MKIVYLMEIKSIFIFISLLFYIAKMMKKREEYSRSWWLVYNNLEAKNSISKRLWDNFETDEFIGGLFKGRRNVKIVCFIL